MVVWWFCLKMRYAQAWVYAELLLLSPKVEWQAGEPVLGLNVKRDRSFPLDYRPLVLNN